MTKLSKLHARLRRLRRRRQNLRWSTGYSALVIAVLWVLVGTFLVDWLFHTNHLQRVVLLAIGAGIVVWAFRRYTRPWLGARESEVDMALMVERQKHIDSDLVAALQFESPEAPAWGSVQLEDAVIDNTARLSTRLDVTEALPQTPLARRTWILLATAAMVVAGIGFRPDYAAIFFSRLLMGSEHYPTATQIETVRINDKDFDPDLGYHWVVEGKKVKFEVSCSGRIPATGRAELEILGGSAGTTVVLQPTEEDRTVFTGELPGLADPVRYQIYLGDAWTDPGELLLVPLPTIEVTLDVTPPDYAAGPKATSGETGQRQISVIEGSQVRVRIASTKPLEEAILSIDDVAYPMARQPKTESEEKTEDETEEWALEPGKSPLAAVLEQIRYSIQVTDVHDLPLERPVQGVIRIKADRRPRVTAGILTEYILPAARPTVVYEVWDDYGVARIHVLRQVVHEDGKTEEDEVELFKLAEGAKPEVTREAVHRLDLSGLKLVKGDQLRITVCGTDYRGPREGKIGFSEPLVFQVTDVAGILAAISEADKQSARELKEMIQRQINVGEEP